MYQATNYLAENPYLGEGNRTVQLQCLPAPVLILDGFEVGDYRLKPHHYTTLTNLVSSLAGLPATIRSNLILFVEGHTDSSGTEVMNRGLSLSRATEVIRFLTSSGVTSRMAPVARGESRPRSPNTTPDGQRRNRRVEIRACRLLPPPPPPPIRA
jgi:outer membrane protein OmpA-like peptidoglycan-associated protein